MSSQIPMSRKPYGTEDYDRGALNEHQQKNLNNKKIDLRIQNEHYLREHPEIKLLTQDFLRECFLNKPDNVKEFAAEYFTNADLKEKVRSLFKEKESKYEFNKIIQQTTNETSKHKRREDFI